MLSKRSSILIFSTLSCLIIIFVAIILVTIFSSSFNNPTSSNDMYYNRNNDETLYSFGKSELDCSIFNTLDVRGVVSDSFASLSSEQSSFPEMEEYECTGHCYCDNGIRRNSGLVIPLTKYVVFAGSALVAFQFAKDWFYEECKENFQEQCENSVLQSSVDQCDVLPDSTGGSLLSTENKNLLLDAFEFGMKDSLIQLSETCHELSLASYSNEGYVLEAMIEKIEEFESKMIVDVTSQVILLDEEKYKNQIVNILPLIKLIIGTVIVGKLLEKVAKRVPKIDPRQDRIQGSANCILTGPGIGGMAQEVFCDDPIKRDVKELFEKKVIPSGSYDYVSMFEPEFKGFYDRMKRVLQDLCHTKGAELEVLSIKIVLEKMPTQHISCGLKK